MTDRSLKFSRPLFHIDSSNVFCGRMENDSTPRPLMMVAVSSELSVTRASMLADCPMKFYLSNIIKFSEEDVEYLNGLAGKVTEHETDDHLPAPSKLSSLPSASAERGTHLHRLLAKLIQSNWTMTVEDESKKSNRDRDSISWVKGLLEQYRQEGDEFYSETPLKFKFAGHMIAGTPDLIVQS